MLESEHSKESEVVSDQPLSGKSKVNIEQSWEIVLDAFEQAYNIAKGLDDNKLAEELLCNVGIAKVNMELDQRNAYFKGIVQNIPDFEDEDDEEAIDGNEDYETTATFKKVEDEIREEKEDELDVAETYV